MGVLTKEKEGKQTDIQREVEGRSFSKESTLITKGVLVLLLLFHHLFYDSAVLDVYDVVTISSNMTFLGEIVKHGNICIAGFAFLSAFGITRNLKKSQDRTSKGYLKAVCRRILKLESSIWFVFLLTVIYKKLALGESFKLTYVGAENKFEPLYMLIDMCGLATYFGTPYMNVTWWYLSFAVMLIAAMPILYVLYEKYRYALIPAGLLLPVVIFKGDVYFASLLPAVILGIAFAYEDWFEKLEQSAFAWQHRVLQIVVCIALFILSFELCANIREIYCYPFAFLLAYVAYAYLAKVPLLRSVLKFIGEHATNIFLVHTFIYFYFYSDFIYSFRYSWCILLALLLVSLIVSVVIELLKKLAGYEWVINKILTKVEKI